MSYVRPAKLRIFCLCGQKMKVSSDMFGKPGKCIACRQKIRIPRLDELPPDTMDLYLKDHPEFIRVPARPKAAKPPAPAPVAAAKAAREPEAAPAAMPKPVTDLGDAQTRALQAIPLEVLRPLHLLLNFDAKVRRLLHQQEAANQDQEEGVPVPDNGTLMGYRTLVQSALRVLRRSLQVHLDKIGDELRVTRDQSLQATLDFRTGDMDYSTYARIVTPLRKRRERLFYQWQNIRGWLKVETVPMAGGHLAVNLKEIPVEAIALTLPPYPLAEASLVEHGTQGLRGSLRERTHAERRLNELDRMAAENKAQGKPLKRARADEEAARLRARTAVAYYRTRLEQLVRDYEDDHDAILAHTEILMRRTQRGELDRHSYRKRIVELQRAKKDVIKARTAVIYALNANSADDVPYLQHSIFARLARPGVPRGMGYDSYAAFASAAMALLAAFLPIAQADAGSTSVIAPGYMLGAFFMAGIVGLIGAVPRRDLRGALLNGALLVGAYAAAVYCFVSWHAVSPLGMAWRSAPQWWAAPGLLALFAALATLGVAGFLSLKRMGPLRYFNPLALLLVIAGVFLAATRFMGIATEAPAVREPERAESNEAPGAYDVAVTVENSGWMPFWLGARWPDKPAAYTFYLERKLGADSWADFSIPKRPAPARSTPQTFPELMVQGSGVRLAYQLEPGTYRIRLEGPNSGRSYLEKSFTLVDFDTDAGYLGEAAPASESAAPEAATPEAVETAPDTSLDIDVRLKGVLTNQIETRFALELYFPDGAVVEKNVLLGDIVAGTWVAQEFNSERNSLNLTDGTHRLVLNTGQQTPLRVPEPGAD
ncbi:MAG: hypothetical protein HYV27_06275 [Candidatus Hydrogenedentes bacterium]|nr:hypothetical protein [Candidatus Hydrogenedentota bacterium]